VHFVPRDYVVANLVGVATPMTIVVLEIARASVPAIPVLLETSAASFQIPCLMRCLSIATIMLVKERTISTVTMLSSLLQSLFLALAPLVIPLSEKGKLLLSLPKPPMKLLEDGLQHQMDHTHGVTASLENKVVRATTVHQVANGLVRLVENISDEAPSKFHTTTTMGHVEEPSELTS
jgi:hypothetical protein